MANERTMLEDLREIARIAFGTPDRLGGDYSDEDARRWNAALRMIETIAYKYTPEDERSEP